MKLPRIYPILDTRTLALRALSAEHAAAALIEAGAGVLQYRHKGDWTRVVFEEAERVAGLCRQASVRFIVNDRADMAMLLEAGLHVGQEDLLPGLARKLMGPGATIGYSTHNAAQLAAGDGEPVTYLAIGPIFVTGTKEKPDPVVGLDGLRHCRALTRKPLVAIGGITRATAADVFGAGADSVAVIGDLYPRPATPKSIRERMEEWRQRTAE